MHFFNIAYMWGMLIFWLYCVKCFIKIFKINFLCFFSLFKMVMRIFKITNVACVIFLLDSTTLDNYQKTCFHSSTYSPSDKHSSQLLLTLRRQTMLRPMRWMMLSYMGSADLPLQLPSGGSLQSSCPSQAGSRALQAVLSI